MTNPANRYELWERPETEGGTQEAKRLSRFGCTGCYKVTRKQKWFDLIAVRISPEKTDWQPDAVLVSLWEPLKPDQQFRHASAIPTTPSAQCAPTEARDGGLFGMDAGQWPSGDGPWGHSVAPC